MQRSGKEISGGAHKKATRGLPTKQFNKAAFALALLICSAAQAQESNPASSRGATTNGVSQLPEVLVEGREDSLVGVADTASQGTVGAEQIEQRPIARAAEILETVPGLIITQHSGTGKANQFFLRGFNLDHGTDFSTDIDGMPINLPTHGHGQGWTDLNMMIPELVYRLNYKKGVYYADEGDFSSAGAVDIDYYKVLPSGLAIAEAGSFGYYRGLVADSPKLGPGNLLYALEYMHNDGPWDRPDDYNKGNGVLTYSQGDDSLGFSVTGMGYYGIWDSTDQIPERAVASGQISRFGTINSTDGGRSHRYSLQGEWHRANDESSSRIMAYVFQYDLDLFSDFTYFLDDEDFGDQFHQHDDRITSGLKGSHSWYYELLGRETETTLGLQVRNDLIHNGLFHTFERQTLEQIREDDIVQTSVSPYAEHKTIWTDKFRSTLGLRGDIYNFDVDSDNSVNSGNKTDAIVSPKFGLVAGPWNGTEVYFNAGLGFHSNDGRGTTTRLDPTNPDPTDPAARLEPVDALARSYGAEVGVRTTVIPNLHSTVSLWWLDIDSELLFIGDAGVTEASRPSRRYGVEFANYYTPTKWLTLDADFSLSQARFRDDDPAGDEIPGSVASVIASGITFHDLNGFFGGLRLRYFGPRPLVEDGSVESGETILLTAHAGYRFNKHWELRAEVFNLLDRKDSEIDYYYESRLRNEPSGVATADRHFHPVEPISFRVALTANF